MEHYYTDERNAQIVIYLLKANNIRKVIASPGGTNVTFVASIQQDPFFEIYSCIDERSAAYMACGLSAESGEPVVLSCTGATASRNYVPGLTEAYYRKLPILAITSSQVESHLENLHPQAIDRRVIQNDIAKKSVNIPIVKDYDDEIFCEVQMNRAIHSLKKNGGGPVHVNLETNYSDNYSVKVLPKCRVINYVTYESDFPKLPEGRIGIYIGSHSVWTSEEIKSIDSFCQRYNAVVFCDHTSNYTGEYGIHFSLIGSQKQYTSKFSTLDLMIHIGEISGDYFSHCIVANQVWRCSLDGEIRDYFKHTTCVFEMSEKYFFTKYTELNYSHTKENNNYISELKNEYKKIYDKIPDLPFSNLYCAKVLSQYIPNKSVIHFGILNSLRSWNMFELPDTVTCFSNVGGFGIDGGVSSLLGAGLNNHKQLHFGVFGDLLFFYDMNSIGNYNINNNIRILLINNGLGVEFKKYDGVGDVLGSDTNKYIAAEGHYGKKSAFLVKHYAEDLGFKYLCASNKEEFQTHIKEFVTESISNKSIIFEVFTNEMDENEAFKIIQNLEIDGSEIIKNKMKQGLKNMLGTENIKKIKNVLGR